MSNDKKDPGALSLPKSDGCVLNTNAVLMRIQSLMAKHGRTACPDHWADRLATGDGPEGANNYADGVRHVFELLDTLALSSGCPPAALLSIFMEAFGDAVEANRHLPHVAGVEVGIVASALTSDEPKGPAN